MLEIIFFCWILLIFIAFIKERIKGEVIYSLSDDYSALMCLFNIICFPGVLLAQFINNIEYKKDIHARHESLNKEIQNRKQNLSARINQLSNSQAINLILNEIKKYDHIQKITLSKSGLEIYDKTGPHHIKWLQLGINDLSKPYSYEVENHIDEPYLLACTINSKLGNIYIITSHLHSDGDWSSVVLQRKLLEI